MSNVGRLLTQIESGDVSAAERLLPLVYDDLRNLAATMLAKEKPGQTLQATALVHEAYVRLTGTGNADQWDHRGHFFTAAAEAMRRILVDRARRKAAAKHGGEFNRIELDLNVALAPEVTEDLVALDDALSHLEVEYPVAAELVKLRYFAGLSLADAAAAMELSERTAGRQWSFARAWVEAGGRGERKENLKKSGQFFAPITHFMARPPLRPMRKPVLRDAAG